MCKTIETGQKKRIKLMFDIMACPLWIYDENDCIFANAGVCDDGSFRHNRLYECKNGEKGGFVMAEPLLEGQTELMNLLNRLADEHDDMYEGERFDFRYCKTVREAEEFAARLNTAWRMLNTVLGGKYKLELAESLDKMIGIMTLTRRKTNERQAFCGRHPDRQPLRLQPARY